MAFITVELDEFSDEELLEELERRNLNNPKLLAIFNAMHQNKQEEAWELMRAYVCDKTGRVI